MTYTARLKVLCNDKKLLSNLNYSFFNETTKQKYGGKIDSNGCTKVYNCNKLDLIYITLISNNAPLLKVRIPALEKGEFNKSKVTLPSTTGTTKKAESNKVTVKVKNELEIAIDNLHGTAIYFGNNFLAHDGALRQAYIKQIKQMSNQYLIDVKSGKIALKKAAEEANQLRNSILEATRKKNSPIALAASQKEKMAAKTLEQFLEYYALKLKDPKKFDQLKSQSRQTLDNFVKKSAKLENSYLADSSGKCNSIKTSHNFTRCIPA